MPVLLDIRKQFDAVVRLGNEQVGFLDLPIHVARFKDFAQADEIRARFVDVLTLGERDTRGQLSADERVEARKLASTFAREVIAEFVTIDAGLITIDGEAVTTGAGIVDAFLGNADALNTITMRVMSENALTGLIAKNSISPRGSGTSSPASRPTAGGGAPASTATSAETPATTASATAGDPPATA